MHFYVSVPKFYRGFLFKKKNIGNIFGQYLSMGSDTHLIFSFKNRHPNEFYIRSKISHTKFVNILISFKIIFKNITLSI